MAAAQREGRLGADYASTESNEPTVRAPSWDPFAPRRPPGQLKDSKVGVAAQKRFGG